MSKAHYITSPLQSSVSFDSADNPRHPDKNKTQQPYHTVLVSDPEPSIMTDDDNLSDNIEDAYIPP
jgi:hypothetical protein